MIIRFRAYMRGGEGKPGCRKRAAAGFFKTDSQTAYP